MPVKILFFIFFFAVLPFAFAQQKLTTPAPTVPRIYPAPQLRELIRLEQLKVPRSEENLYDGQPVLAEEIFREGLSAGTALERRSNLGQQLQNLTPIRLAGGDAYQRDMLTRFPFKPYVYRDGRNILLEFTPTQLQLAREQDPLDQCLGSPPQKNFLGSIENSVRLAMIPRKIETNSYITNSERGFDLRSMSDSSPVSLLTHPFCVQDEKAIMEMIGPLPDYRPERDRTPKIDTVTKLRDFTDALNTARAKILLGSEESQPALHQYVGLWTQFMGCLAYEESLQSTGEPNSASEKSNREQFAVAMKAHPEQRMRFMKGDAKEPVQPLGVQFGEDTYGDYYSHLKKARAAYRKELEAMLTAKGAPQFTKEQIDSKVGEKVFSEIEAQFKPWPVVGLYQFNPIVGNVAPCIAQWNKLVSDARCKLRNSKNSILTAVSTAGQTFNAFCGTQKIVQAFNSQINTYSPLGVDRSNVLPTGELRPPNDRCLSIVGRGGSRRVYAHFGVLANSTVTNLGRLMDCVDFVRKL